MCVQNRVHHPLYDSHEWAGAACHKPNVRTLHQYLLSVSKAFEQHRLREEEGETGSNQVY